MRKNPWLMLVILLFAFGTLFMFLLGSSMISLFGDGPVKVAAKNSILHLQLKGIIMDGKKVLKPLIKYREDNHIKAVVVEINSPGGVVGPSQELYEEIRRVREQYKKPVVAVSTSLVASGGYYAAVAADKILVAPGTMLGSMGVIMEFVNLEKLYDWAKVSRYTITTGKYKDSGAEYRSMRPDEKDLFQELVNDVHQQFKDAVATGRNLKPEFVEQYADGRVFTGRQAVKLGFADQFGTVEDAFKLAAEMAGLDKDEYEIFEPPKSRGNFFDFFADEEEDEAYTKLDQQIDAAIKRLLKADLANKPLFLMPGVYQ